MLEGDGCELSSHRILGETTPSPFSRKPTIPIRTGFPLVDSKQKTLNSQIFRGGTIDKEIVTASRMARHRG
jgi:hypothetical protein